MSKAQECLSSGTFSTSWGIASCAEVCVATDCHLWGALETFGTGPCPESSNFQVAGTHERTQSKPVSSQGVELHVREA